MFFKTFCAALAVIVALGNLPLHARPSAKIYVGGGDEHRGAFDGYLSDPEGWVWVRQNADGYYLNTFPLKTNADDAAQNSRLSAMARLFTNKNLFYETEAESYAHRVHDADDRTRIKILQQNGFNLTYVTCNGAFTDERAALLKTWSGIRPLLALMGPWAIGGDINHQTNPKATQWRTLIEKNDGSATDSPLAIWATNSQNCRNGSYSGVRYAHAHGKLAEVMLCPHKLGTDANWLAESEQYIRDHEDNDALPDLWAVSYYAAYLEAHAVTPEQVNGAPAASITGVAYYLIHHLRDNDHAARLTAPTQPSLTSTSDGANLALNAPSRTFQIDLGNSSSWLDLTPVIKARIDDVNSVWKVAILRDGQDITAAVKSDEGYCFYKADRLNPGNNKAIAITVASKSGQVGTGTLDIVLQLFPHPTTPVVQQTLHLRNFTPDETDRATSNGAK